LFSRHFFSCKKESIIKVDISSDTSSKEEQVGIGYSKNAKDNDVPQINFDNTSFVSDTIISDDGIYLRKDPCSDGEIIIPLGKGAKITIINY